MFFLVYSMDAQVKTNTDQNAVKTTTQSVNKKQTPANPKTKSTNVVNQQQINNPNAPVIVFDKMIHDYGTIEQMGDGNCEFIMTNEGKEPLILSNVRSSCGCTTPQWPRNPILPGESATIKVKYDTKRVGPFKKHIYVHSNAKTERVTLTISGSVNAKPGAVIPEKKKPTPSNTIKR